MNASNLFLACGTCRDTMITAGGEAASWSIFFLLAVILAMLGGVGIFMFNLSRREKEHFDPTLSDDYSAADAAR